MGSSVFRSSQLLLQPGINRFLSPAYDVWKAVGTQASQRPFGTDSLGWTACLLVHKFNWQSSVLWIENVWLADECVSIRMRGAHIGGLHFHLRSCKPRRLFTHAHPENIDLHWKEIINAKSVPLLSWNARIKLAFNVAPCCIYYDNSFSMIPLHYVPFNRSLYTDSVHRNSRNFLMRIQAGLFISTVLLPRFIYWTHSHYSSE